ncbi:MAG TPA: NAD-dependent succinate-semialdehyde dehydrogenase [Acidimicrobiales bacterium]|nr:NAD-dependent succinate-semialdehyde dehydrogenase [Acidimicrobiales bacterium]
MATLPFDAPTRAFIGGAFSPAAGGSTFPVLDPASGALLADVADCGAAEALAALDAACAAQRDWAATPPRERSELLRRAFELMIERRDPLARLIVLENGKALPDATGEITYAAEFLRFYAEEAVRNRGEFSTAPGGANRLLVLHQPVGPCLLVTPWNFPQAMLTRKLGPALAAGCTVVAKPAEDTPLSALALAELFAEAGLPEGVMNVVPTNRPAEVVGALLSDSRLRKLSFTGSTEVGRLLLAQAAPGVVNTSVELGGNAPFLVFADADLDAAVAGAMVAKMRHGGETCTAANRFYVQAPVAAEFSRRLAAAMGGLKVAPGLQEGSEVGALVNAAAIEKVERLVDGALAAGARALVGGRRVDRAGYFYPPTVLGDVAPEAAILAEEIFGPVAPISAFDDEEEAIARANDTEFGLVAYLYTGDLGRGLRVAEALETGMVGLNRGLVSDPAAPFGGMKQSGLGREGGHEGMEEYLETKYVALSW